MHSTNDIRIEPVRSGPAYQAYLLLRFTFTIAPIIAGLDKFFYFLTRWDQYLSPTFNVFHNIHAVMIVVGIIEIIVGIGVAIKPKIFSYIVAIWLIIIIINLIILGQFWDIALRDLGLLLSVLALSRLSHVYDFCHRCKSKA